MLFNKLHPQILILFHHWDADRNSTVRDRQQRLTAPIVMVRVNALAFSIIYFSLEKSGGLTDQHCHSWSYTASMTETQSMTKKQSSFLWLCEYKPWGFLFFLLPSSLKTLIMVSPGAVRHMNRNYTENLNINLRSLRRMSFCWDVSGVFFILNNASAQYSSPHILMVPQNSPHRSLSTA